MLYDDRDVRPGVKFMDADLIGIPIRLTISDRSIKRGGTELKHRNAKAITLIPLDEVVLHVDDEIKKLRNDIYTKIRHVSY